ncbi:MAG: hypothetical protein H8D63_02865 [Parcubacteria group bacterium]|nr:hypothetical protein [Parcubacteria group bacterium]
MNELAQEGYERPGEEKLFYEQMYDIAISGDSLVAKKDERDDLEGGQAVFTLLQEAESLYGVESALRMARQLKEDSHLQRFLEFPEEYPTQQEVYDAVETFLQEHA